MGASGCPESAAPCIKCELETLNPESIEAMPNFLPIGTLRSNIAAMNAKMVIAGCTANTK